MKKIFLSALLVVATGLAGCSQDVAKHDSRQRHVAYLSRPDYFKHRRTVVGSNIPIPEDELTFGPVSATAPPESFARDRPSLYPVEPIVGATPRDGDAETRSVNVGAGPAGSNPLPGGN